MLITLNERLELAKKHREETLAEYLKQDAAVVKQFESILHSTLMPYGAIMNRCFIKSYLSDKSMPIFYAEIGFHNEAENRLDFGSSFDLTFEKGRIFINMGTIGSYNADSIYQVKRIHVVSDIWKNVKSLEQSFSRINIEDYIAAVKADDDAQLVISRTESDIVKFLNSEILKTLKVDDVYKKSSTCGHFGPWRGSCPMKIVKITAKKVWCVAAPDDEDTKRWYKDETCKVDISAFVDSIRNNNIYKVEVE